MSPGFLFAALLWHEVLAAWNNHQAKGKSRSQPCSRRWMMCWRWNKILQFRAAMMVS